MPAAAKQLDPERVQCNRLKAAVHIKLAELEGIGAMSEEDYRDLLERDFKVKSSAELDLPGLVALLRRLKGQPVNLYRARRAYWQRQGLRGGMATAEQIAMIEELWARVSRSPEPDKALRVFLQRRFRVSDLRFLTLELAGKAIQALRAMERRGR